MMMRNRCVLCCRLVDKITLVAPKIYIYTPLLINGRRATFQTDFRLDATHTKERSSSPPRLKAAKGKLVMW